jgi:hypothetical protein
MTERKEKQVDWLLNNLAEVPPEQALLESWEKIYLHALRDNASLLDVALEKHSALTGTSVEKLRDRLRFVCNQEGYAKALNRVRDRIDSLMVGA